VPGYPIRTPWDHSSVDSSPRPIAASHVLHRLLVPRHPPSALDNLTTKMLASTVQFSTNNQPTTHHPHTPPTRGSLRARSRLDRKKHPTHEQPNPTGQTTQWFVLSGLNRVPTADHQPHQTTFLPHHRWVSPTVHGSPRQLSGCTCDPAVAGTDSPVSPPTSTPTATQVGRWWAPTRPSPGGAP
jgi:hypothetical protein